MSTSTHLDCLISALNESQDPRAILLYLLQDHADSLGWDYDSLIGACAEHLMNVGVADSIKMAEDALQELITRGEVLAENISEHPLAGRIVTLS
jgi:hypothetical protein